MKCTIWPYLPEDAAPLWEAARESVVDVFPWLAWCHPYSPAEAEQWVARHVEAGSGRGEFAFAIVGADGRFLGGCGINQVNRIHSFGKLGYWVRTSATGRGVAAAAVRQAAAFAFRETALVRLEIACAIGNTRSQRVAERAGAAHEGVLRSRLLLHGKPVDAVMYSLVQGA